MKTLIVTGGIGSGKSEVGRILERMGFPVYDADSRMKSLYDTDPEIVPAIEKALGRSFRGEDGHLDRKALAAAVFSDREKLRTLELTTHPFLFRDFRRWAAEQKGGCVVMESAVYCSSPCDDKPRGHILLVDAPVELRLERARRRDGTDERDVQARMDAQHPEDIHPDAVIINDGTLADLENKVRTVMETIFSD